jgi:N-methylhydantoinase B/oxoprolinase/acetone carboxylase alpha subunit
MQEGESLYETAMRDYQSLESQLDDLEARLAAKQAEVNQIAQMIGKAPVEGSRRLTAQIIEPERNASPSSPANIARALTGRNFGR